MPSLFRAVLPGGLPNLKSLFIIGQNMIEEYYGIQATYATEGGIYMPWSVDDTYIRSITRGAPNLEELAFNDHEPQFVSHLFPSLWIIYRDSDTS